MERPHYTFEEFMQHVVDVPIMLDSAKANLEPEESERGNAPFEWTVVRVYEFMGQKYQDSVERMHKSQRYCLMMHYLSTHISEFDTEDFAVFGSKRVGGLLGEHLLRAVFETFANGALPDKEPTPEEMRELASKFREPKS
ncbi:hypothetical protein BH10PLA2_BH10PLA2_25010 [soil metagenome]